MRNKFDEALFLYKEVFRFHRTLTSLHNLANIYQVMGHSKKALPLFEESLALHTEIAENRQSLFTQYITGYFKLSQLYLTRTRADDAFRLSEMTKARTLVESITMKLAAQKANLSPIEQQQIQNNQAQLAALNDKIARESNPNQRLNAIKLSQTCGETNQCH
ncbi:MAG: tetratricopeptide repeat protein [Pseudomonadota bacterium]